MKIQNVKIYSGNIYSSGLSIQLPLIENNLPRYYDFTTQQISQLDEYNRQYFIYEKPIFNQAFFIGCDDGIFYSLHEVLTGIKIFNTSSKKLGNFDSLRTVGNNRYVLETQSFIYDLGVVHIKEEELHEELDVERVKDYIKKVKPLEIEQAIYTAEQELKSIHNFRHRRSEYYNKNREEVMQLVKKIENSWNNN